MKKGTTLKRWVALLMAMLLTASLFAIPAFAHEGHDHAEESKGLSTGAIIGIVIGAVVLVVAVVLCIKFWDKIAKFLRVYKSEAKKIVWLPWDQTKKSTLVVIVILIACAAAICLIDLGLQNGFLAFIKLFQK